jgi:hypothetical protein
MDRLLLDAAPTDQNGYWMLVAFAVLTILIAVFGPWFKKKKDPLARSPAQGSLAQQRSVERQMSNLLVELSDMARQVSAQLDTRAVKLEVLIREADEKIATLRDATSGSAAGGSGGAGDGGESNRGDADPMSAIGADRQLPDGRHSQVYQLFDRGRTCQEIAAELHRPSGEIELILALRQHL